MGPAYSAGGGTQWKAELRGRREERQHHSELRRTLPDAGCSHTHACSRDRCGDESISRGNRDGSSLQSVVDPPGGSILLPPQHNISVTLLNND